MDAKPESGFRGKISFRSIFVRLSSQFRVQRSEQPRGLVFVPDLRQYPPDLVLLADLLQVVRVQEGQRGEVVAIVRGLRQVQQRPGVRLLQLQNRLPDVLGTVPGIARDGRRRDGLQFDGDVPLHGELHESQAVESLLRRLGQHVGRLALPVVNVEPDGGAEVGLRRHELLSDLPVEEREELLGGSELLLLSLLFLDADGAVRVRRSGDGYRQRRLG
mmetsp:Transcript_20423/g.48035  ORF Transcript_20423/g.48035 Transcript_20423/m.48035 type:complete len:217 (-) Transcript_20423:612-1262(-)